MPKGKLLALLAIFAAIGVVTATGAFTSVSAERTATVNTAGDSSALLQIEPGAMSGEYVTDGDATTNIDLTNADLIGSNGGVNVNAETTMDQILSITNNGEDSVYLSIEVDNPNGNAAQYVEFEASSGDKNITTNAGAPTQSTVTVQSGGTVDLDMNVDTTDVSSAGTILIDQITIVAENGGETSN
jgi:P pilus assembly chaperone PapD